MAKPGEGLRRLPAAAAGLAATCCAVHLTLLAAGFGALAATAAGAGVVAVGIAVFAGLWWWATRRRNTSMPSAEPSSQDPRVAESLRTSGSKLPTR